MNVIFLDVDGELTYSEYENDGTANIDLEKVKLLKEICNRTDAKVVITSSWRGSETYTPHIYYTLIDILTDCGIDVLGDAPYISAKLKENAMTHQTFTLDEIPYSQLEFGTGRAAEVQKWLSEHDVDSFVILDDEDWNWEAYGYESHWIRPTWYGNGGLKKEHVEKAVKIMECKLERAEPDKEDSPSCIVIEAD